VLAGGPFVELPGRYRSQWALDTVGAIWGTYDTSPTPSQGRPIWTNYTDPENLVIGTRAVQVSPRLYFYPTLTYDALVTPGLHKTDRITVLAFPQLRDPSRSINSRFFCI
jgi:hypothetical protein